MKHTIRLSDTSHVSFPATSSLPPSIIEIILLPASTSSITLGAGIQAGDLGGGGYLSEKKRRKIPVFVTDCIHDGNAISVVVAVVVLAALPIDSLSLRCTVQYHNTT
jgi:hypothetical protein